MLGENEFKRSGVVKNRDLGANAKSFAIHTGDAKETSDLYICVRLDFKRTEERKRIDRYTRIG